MLRLIYSGKKKRGWHKSVNINDWSKGSNPSLLQFCLFFSHTLSLLCLLLFSWQRKVHFKQLNAYWFYVVDEYDRCVRDMSKASVFLPGRQAMDHFTRQIITRWTPLFFFSVKRLYCSIIVLPGMNPVRVTLSLFSTSYARAWFRASFLCCKRKCCRCSILRHFRIYVIAGSNVKCSRHWTTEMRYSFSHFDSFFDFQSRKQNRAEFLVYKNYKLHI
jgi:hypothetical protein